jgi:hypothetical protein
VFPRDFVKLFTKPGRLMVTDEQVRLLRRKLMENHKKDTAAAGAGMSVRSAQKWQHGALPSQAKKARTWRTRHDPFIDVWDDVVVPLLKVDEDGGLQGTTVMEMLLQQQPDRYGPAHLRTLQRRMRDWRAMHGPHRVVYFEQVHPPGREAAFDFTHATELGVTIAGELFVHLVFQLVLSFSKWRWACLAYGETFEAMMAGIQGALWELGGVPGVLRSDNLSAATHELLSGGRALTKRYREVIDHYGTTSTRIAPGESHENGVVEKSHHVLKTALDQALRLRGSREFADIGEYERFLAHTIARLNRPTETRLVEERGCLSTLPSAPLPSYTKYDRKVTCWSTVSVGDRIYSVPSRLIGYWVELQVHPDVVEVHYKQKLAETMPRLRGDRLHRIDYRHVIWSLVRKPGAFARYRYREELFPSLAFRRTYDALKEWRGDRADVEYVRILHLAASTMEVTVERALTQLLERGEPFDYAAVRAVASPDRPAVPEVRIPRPDFSVFDRLLATGGER